MATNLIQIKRSLTTANATSLANGELAYTANGDVLWIGSNGGIKAIGGGRTPGTLTANQALVANSTSGIDKIITANAVVTTLTANGTTGTAGQLLTSNGTVAYWANPASSSFTITGDSGSDSFSTGQSLAFVSANGLTTAVTDNQVSFSVDTGSTLTVNATGIHVNTTNLSIATSQLTGDVALGTNTSGNYVATITAGAGISGSSTGEGGTPTIAVVAGAGIASNATGVHVVAGNGTIVSNATGVYVNASALSVATSQLTGDVALGTNTSGNYVATITAGNGISGSSTGEGGTPTIAVVAGSGIASNSTGVHAVAGAGIASNSTGVHVVAGAGGGLVSNSTGVFISATDGLIANSTGLHVGAGNGIAVATDSVRVLGGSTLTVNTTGTHVNSTLSITSLTTSGDIQVGGNLTILGDLLTINVATLAVEDSLIQLASNNTTSDLLDIGFFGSYEAGDAGAHEHTGIFRDASDNGIYKIFQNVEETPTTTVNTSAVGYTTGTLEAFLRSGGLVSNSTAVTLTANSTLAVNLTANSLTLTTPLAATSGGTGLNTYTSGDILVANTGNTLSKMALGASGLILMSNGTALTYDTLDGGTF